jgi:hypothetical protein
MPGLLPKETFNLKNKKKEKPMGSSFFSSVHKKYAGDKM